MNRLVQFLYLLGRDELPLGRIEALMAAINDNPIRYTNDGLEIWAREAAVLLSAKDEE